MDFKRALSILIIAFIVLNVFLVLNIWARERPVEDYELTLSQQQEIQSLLDEKGIEIQAEIPEKWQLQPFLEVGYKEVDEEKVIDDFFGQNASPKVELLDNGKNYNYDNKQLIIMENGIITFFDKQNKKSDEQITKNQAIKMAQDFMQSHGGIPKDAEINSIVYDEKSNGYLVQYVRNYDGFFIANSYIDILTTPLGVKSYYQCWLKAYGYKGKKRAVISPLIAVLRVSEELKEHDSTVITDLKQGFYSRFYDAKRWEAAPVWKVQLKSGDIYYINAYTGELEQ